jgi:hypothetical protein
MAPMQAALDSTVPGCHYPATVRAFRWDGLGLLIQLWH